MGGLSFELRVTAPHLCLIAVTGLINGLRQIESAGKLTPAGRRQLMVYCELEEMLLLLTLNWNDPPFITQCAVPLEILMRAADVATHEGYGIEELYSLPTPREFDA